MHEAEAPVSAQQANWLVSSSSLTAAGREVTLLLHLSAERLPRLPIVCRRWGGPVSVALLSRDVAADTEALRAILQAARAITVQQMTIGSLPGIRCDEAVCRHPHRREHRLRVSSLSLGCIAVCVCHHVCV